MKNHNFAKVGRNRGGKTKAMEIQNYQKTNNKMAVVSPYISIIILNKNEFNSPTKRQSG